MQEKSTTILDDILYIIAKRFYSKLPRDPNVKELQFTRAWVAGFKKRHGIRGFTIHGEPASIDVFINTQILIGKSKTKVQTLIPRMSSTWMRPDCF